MKKIKIKRTGDGKVENAGEDFNFELNAELHLRKVVDLNEDADDGGSPRTRQST